MRTGQGHRRPAVALADVQHVAPQQLPVQVALAGHLLGRRQYRLQLAQVYQDGPRVLALLDHSGHDVTLAARVLAERELVFRVAQPLQDDLASRGRGDTAEPGPRVVVFPRHGAVLGRLARPAGHVPAAPVDLDPRRAPGPFAPLIGDAQRLLPDVHAR